MTEKRTIAQTLKKFTLIAGPGSVETGKACVMTALAWKAGRAWTDAPPCAHPILRNNAIAVNDAKRTTPEMRAALVKAGEHGILDTWWITDLVIAWAFATRKGDKRGTKYEQLLAALERIAAWKASKGLPPNLSGANLSGADLSRADLSRANLSGANLSGADLSRADLSGANLSGADLSRADLSRANLSGANLSRADLSRAYLSGADLSRADLSGAYLSRAYLSRANLSGANLSGADLSRADLSGAYLSRADLSRAYLSGAYLSRAYLSRAYLSGADLSRADLSRAVGIPYGGMPDGWQLDDSGLWVRS